MSGASTTAMGPEPYDGGDDGRREEPREHEPSMEEILASIRRIISDDQPSPPPRPLMPRSDPAAGPPVSPMSPLRSSLRALAVADTLPPAAPASAAEGDRPAPTGPFRNRFLARDDAASAGSERPAPERPPAPEPPAAWEDTSPPQGETFDALVEDDLPPVASPFRSSPVSVEQDVGADPAPDAEPSQPADRFDPLVSAETSASIASAFNALAATMVVQSLPSVEDLARDLLRPMLKTWLDDNLPTIVERLVRAEIERVARGGR